MRVHWSTRNIRDGQRLLALLQLSRVSRSVAAARGRIRRHDGERHGSLRWTFYSALTFQKVSDVEVFGDGIRTSGRRLWRADAHRADAARERILDLTQYLAPPGRPIPADSRSNDLWFQHIAIVVRDMDQAFEKLRALKVQFVSTGPQTLPASIPRRGRNQSVLLSRSRPA